MGRGLAAILPESGPGDPAFREVPVELISPNPDQPRRRFDPEALSALADSIAEAGLIQPLLVRPLADGRYELIAGERRWRAAREAGLETVPALVRERRRRAPDADRADRERRPRGPQPGRRGAGLRGAGRGPRALEGGAGAPARAAPRPAISNLIRLLDLPDEVLDLLCAGELSRGPRPRDPAGAGQRRAPAARRATPSPAGWSVRETENRAKAGAARGRAKVIAAPRPGGGAAARRGGARGGVRPRGQGALGAQGHPRRAALRERRRAARVRARRQSRLSAAAPAQGAEALDRPAVALAACSETGRAGARPGPARTRSSAGAAGSRPSAAAAGPSAPREARLDLGDAADRAASRDSSGADCGDAQAPICESRGRVAK